MILDSITKITYDVPAAVIAVSPSYVPTLTDKYHVAPDKIFVIEHGVDTNRFNRITYEDARQKQIVVTEEKSEPISKNLSNSKIRGKPFSDSITKIIYSGGLGIGYDFEPVLRAAKFLENQPVKSTMRTT
jgi:hypothetical protein